MVVQRRNRGPRARLAVVAACATALVGAALLVPSGSSAVDEPSLRAVQKARCGPGSLPETDIQGRVPASDYTSGRAQKGYRCNTRLVGKQGNSGGFKVLRYVDRAGRECAYYDSTLLFPTDVPYNVGSTGLGVVALDMSDPRRPRRTANLTTPAMLTPHESLLLNARRGLLVAVAGTAATAPGIVDVYSVRGDCRRPVLLASSPVGVLGHESGFAPDGRTFYVAGAAGQTLTAVDLTDPRRPRRIFTQTGVNYHGLRLSPDGRTMYVADIGNPDLAAGAGTTISSGGLRVLDVSQIQDRRPDPQVRLLSSLSWRSGSIPQAADPILVDGRRYLAEVDEFANFSLGILGGIGYEADAPVGAARLIDVQDPRRPFVVSNIRLQVHQPEARRGEQRNDPGASLPIQGYTGHYCSVPRYRNPGLMACSMVASGLRVFDIRDPYRPREVAYFNQPLAPGVKPLHEGGWAMSAPAWDLAQNTIWYSDGNTGFYAVRLTNGVARIAKR